jgi:Carboxypeptidase regulatory-like domain
MVHSILKFGALLLLIGVALGQAPSQRPKTIVIGTVSDTNHAVIVGARITARDESGQDYVTTTTDKGAFMLEVPVGLYKVEANAEGFCPKRMNNVEPVNDIVDFVLDVRNDERHCKQKSMLKDQKWEPSSRGIAE